MQRIEKKQKSYIWLDWVRFIGIYCVVLAHLVLPAQSKNLIYAFHMPLFFFISGFLFDAKRYVNYFDFFKEKVKKLLFPYLLFNFLTYIIWLVKMQIEPDNNISVLEVFCQIFYGGSLLHNTPLWFLIALFFVEIALYIPLSKSKGVFVLAFFLILSWLTQYVGWVPLYIDVAIVAAPFYAIAYLCRNRIIGLLNINVYFIIGLMLLSMLTIFFISRFNGRVDMMSNDFGSNFFLFEIGAIVGVVFTFMLGKVFEFFLGNLAIIEYVSRNTLIILALHITVIRFVKGFFMVIHISDSIWNNYLFNVLFSFLIIVVLLPVILLIKRYVPWVIGR